jgi:hypothetical protein
VPMEWMNVRFEVPTVLCLAHVIWHCVTGLGVSSVLKGHSPSYSQIKQSSNMEELNFFKMSGTSNSVTGMSQQIEPFCTFFKPLLLITFANIFASFSFRYIFYPRKLICKCKFYCFHNDSKCKWHLQINL